MNMEELARQISEQKNKIDQIYISVEKTRKYFLWTMIATVVAFIIPLVAIGFILPSMIDSISGLAGTASLGL